MNDDFIGFSYGFIYDLLNNLYGHYIYDHLAIKYIVILFYQ